MDLLTLSGLSMFEFFRGQISLSSLLLKLEELVNCDKFL